MQAKRNNPAAMILYLAELKDLTERDYEKFLAMMSDSRRDALLRMRIENDKKRTVLGEMLARRAISEQTGLGIDKISIIRAENGKPYCENADIHFSISHSKERVVCAVSEQPLGVDTEKIRFTEPRVTRACCVGSDFGYIFESSELPNAFSDEQLERFFTLWTAKEAYCKFTGVGVSGMQSRSLAEIMPNCKIFKDNGFVTAVYSPKTDCELKITDLRRCE